MKRRFQLLESMSKAYRAVTSNCLYIDERLLLALNLINSIDRYAPLLSERRLACGLSNIPRTKIGETDKVSAVLLRSELLGNFGGVAALHHKNESVRTEAHRRMRQRGEDGLPEWLLDILGDLPATAPDDFSLQSVGGLHGLILDGLNVDLSDNNVIHVAHDAEAEDGAVRPSGVFRFVELRFPSLAVARRRAVVLHMCTWSARDRLAVPLLAKSMLYTAPTREHIHRLYDMYDLNWQAGDRVASNQLRQRAQRYTGAVVFANGVEPWSSAARSQWLVAETLRAPLSPRTNQSRRSTSSARHSTILPALAKKEQRPQAHIARVSSSMATVRKVSSACHTIATLRLVAEKASSQMEAETQEAETVSTIEPAVVPMVPVPPSTPRPKDGRLSPTLKEGRASPLLKDGRSSPAPVRVQAGQSEILLASKPPKSGGRRGASTKRKGNSSARTNGPRH